MEQTPSSDANSDSINQEIFHLCMEPEGSLPCSQELASDPYPQPDESSLKLPTLLP